MHHMHRVFFNMAIAIDSLPSTQQRNNRSASNEAGDLSLNALINSVFENSEYAVFGVDADGKIGYWNQRCAELFELPKEISLGGKHCSDLLCGGDRKCATQCCTECAINQNIESEKQINDYQLNIQSADGSEMRVNIATSYFYQQEPGSTSTYFSIRKIEDRA